MKSNKPMEMLPKKPGKPGKPGKQQCHAKNILYILWSFNDLKLDKTKLVW